MNPSSGSDSSVLHVLALGAGYATIFLYRSLERRIRQGKMRFTVVDRNNFHCYHGLVPEMMVGKLQPGNVLSSTRRLFRHAQFRNGEIENIDPAKKAVVFSRALDGKQFTIHYDHLMIGLGSTDDLKRFPGIAQHAMRLKSFPDILAARHHLITMLELADIEEDPVEVERLLSFVVAGGNYAGVEVVGELLEFLPRIAKQRFPNIPVEKIRVTLVHSGQHILPELGDHFPKLQAYAERALQKSPHFVLRRETRLGSATPEEAVLDDGTRIPTRTIISCTGTAASPLLDLIPAPRDHAGRLITDEFTRVKEMDNVWAAGDCAAVPHPRGGTCPPLAIWAMTAGKCTGKNIKATMEGRPLDPYRFTGLGDACTLGHWRAAAQLKGIPVRGLVGYLAWRFFVLLYLPAPEKRLRVFLDWFFTPTFGPDLINMNVHRAVGVMPVMYEPGQDIVREGDIGQSLFIIRSGQVEILKQDPDGGVPLRLGTLGAGDHFGEVAVFQRSRRTATVRATTRVELLHVRREAALALSESDHGIGLSLQSHPVATLVAMETAAAEAAAVQSEPTL